MNLEALEIDVDRDATSSSDDLDDQDDDSVPDGDPYWKKVAIRRKKRLYKVNDGDAGAANGPRICASAIDGIRKPGRKRTTKSLYSCAIASNLRLTIQSYTSS